MNQPSNIIQKLRRLGTFVCAASLFCSVHGLSYAQDESPDAINEALQPDTGSSKPGVVHRIAPKEETPAEAPAEETIEEPAGTDQSGVTFGEQYQFESNFGEFLSPKPTPSNVKITLDFRNADLGDVVKLMSAQTGRNFIIADSLRSGKKITIISPNPVSSTEAYQAFLSALQMNGLTVIQSGKFYKIVDSATGNKEPIAPTWGDEAIPKNDQLVTHIVTVENVDVSQIKTVLDQLKSPNGLIVDYAASNTLIITDTGNSVNRMLAFIKKMDVSSADGEKLWVYPVQYADASDLEAMLQQVFQIRGGNARNNNNNNNNNNADNEVRISQIVADDRTNKLIIVANDRSYEKIKRLILKLDVEIPDSGRINVVHLQNSDATEVASVLTDLLSKVTDKSTSSSRGGGGTPPGMRASQLLQGEVSVVANTTTNDLIVVASPRDFLSMKSVIKELDRARRQVFVEAVILEVSLERTKDLGITMHGGNTYETSQGDGYFAGRTELNSLQSLSPAAMFLSSGSYPGLLAAIVGPSVKIAGLELPSLGAVINALQTNTDVNVLSTPTILTLDNQEAEISVGERIPYITNTGSNSALLGGAGDTTSALTSLLSGYGTQITRVDIALKLKILPQINEGGTVRLEVEEEIEEVKPGGSDLGGPTTRMRNLKTVVVVPDQQTVVLGGLIRDSESQSVSKLPLLGDIPVLGYLFRSTETTVQKQNLLLMLTPYIIESNSDLEKIRIRKEQEREEFLEYFGRKDLGYVRSINFDKKHGIIEQIRQSIDAKEAELNAIREAQDIMQYASDDEGIELPEGFSDGYTSGGGSYGKRASNTSASNTRSNSGGSTRPTNNSSRPASNANANTRSNRGGGARGGSGGPPGVAGGNPGGGRRGGR